MAAQLRVNEANVNLYAPRDAANWWALYRAHGPASRFTVITPMVPGDVVDVACDDRAHAEDLRQMCIDRGIPKAALTIHADRKTPR